MKIERYLSTKLQIEEGRVAAVLKMLQNGATIPFIARYKKEETGNLSDVSLRLLESEKEKFEKLSERKETVLKTIAELGKLSDELRKEIDECDDLQSLEAVYRPYRPKRKTRGSLAKEKGLGPLSAYIKKQENTLDELNEFARQFVNEEKGIADVGSAIKMACDILAEEMSDNASYYTDAKKYILRTGKILAKETKEDVDKKYANYANFATPIGKIKPHQILAIMRGNKEKKIQYSFDYDEITIHNAIARNYLRRPKSPYETIIRETIADSYKRLMGPSIENEITNDLFSLAEDESLLLFSKNLKQLLLASPLKGKQILGFDPGYKNGCKLALIDKEGKVLKTGIIYPTIGKIAQSESYLDSLLRDYGFDVIALGNGTASRESDGFLQGYLEKRNLKEKISIIVVNESGASVYSASPIAIKEFPDMDIDERSAVSLARRLLDPMAELVKVPPESIGVGQYQHDMDEKKLKLSLERATVDAVNEVGVWLNTSSASLLQYVSGISSRLANEIVSYREKNGPFKERKSLLEVKGFGEKTFLDAAGFLRIENNNPLEKTAIHPKDYEATKTLIKTLGLSLNEIGSEKAEKLLSSDIDLAKLEKETGLGNYTLKDIIEELKKPGRDPREKAESASLDSNVKDIKDLRVGMLLNGTVRNISDFGAFIDIGVHQDGLAHISELADRYVKNPNEVVSLGEIVHVKVIGVDVERKRISLSLKRAKEESSN